MKRISVFCFSSQTSIKLYFSTLASYVPSGRSAVTLPILSVFIDRIKHLNGVPVFRFSPHCVNDIGSVSNLKTLTLTFLIGLFSLDSTTLTLNECFISIIDSNFLNHHYKDCSNFKDIITRHE